MDALINKTIQWHNDRNLIEGSTDVAQHTKLVEEVKELETNILLSQPIADDIGDILVVLQVAYDDIKDRKGKMVNGVFVKERIDQSATAPTVYKKGIIYRMGFIDGRKKVARGDIWKEFGDHSLTYNQGYNAGLIHEQGGRL